jgi:hypothetical protein
MKTHLKNHRSVTVTMLILAALLGVDRASARPLGEHQAPLQSLDRQGQPRLEGLLVADVSSGLKFLPRADTGRQPMALEPGSVVSFQGSAPVVASIPPLFQVLVGESARISGMLRAVGDQAVTLFVPWQSGEIRVARPGVQAVLQRPGEARVFADGFDRLDPSRWSVGGKPELLPGPKASDQRRGVRLPAGGSSLEHRLSEPLVSGRLELSFLDGGPVAVGQQWTLDLTFRGPTGPATLRILLGWAEESLAVESPQGPSLAVQRLARSPGWHRLMLRFGPEQTEIAVDGKELAHGKGPSGPLSDLRIATRSTSSSTVPPDLSGFLGEIQVVRFAEPPASPEIDPTQDEVRLVVGDQLYGTIRQADSEHVVIEVDDKPVSLDWSEVAGLHFRRIPAASVPVAGALARLEWRAAPGEPNQARDLDYAEGAITAICDSAITLATPYAGTLTIPRDRLARLRVLDRGWQLVLDPSAHHLGDNISTTPPLLDPPLPEGGVLERSFELDAVSPRQGFMVLDVLQVVGETAGSPYSNLVLKGELRTYVAVNGKRIDYINRYITTSNETPERIRVPIPPDLLKPGKNVIRIEQTGIANDPTWFDDLGILQIALQFSMAGNPSPDRPASSAAKP